uniref:Activin types I and II receptor domain-containing protein n=1 Tax=Myotis lucifugus TaxID=59463 RepID=G1Q8M1_MYOLU
MGTSSAVLCILFFCGALGKALSLPRGGSTCYTCSFAKPCYPVPTECGDDEACGVSIGTSGRTLVQWPSPRWSPTRSVLPPLYPHASASPLPPTEQNEVIQRKGCLPRAQCPLPGHATYWSRSYALRHHCCDQDLCNGAPRPLVPTLLLTASFTCGGHLLL